MGLFDGISSQVRQSSQTSLSPAEGFVALTLLASAVDGHMSDDEIQTINAVLERMQLFRSYPSEVIGKMINNLIKILKQQGFDAFLEMTINSIPYSLHDTAFAIATDIVLIDGVMTEGEQFLLEKLYIALDVEAETAQSIINVMLIKNRG